MPSDGASKNFSAGMFERTDAPDPGEPQRVDRIGAKHLRIAKRGHLRPLVHVRVIGAVQRQDVLRVRQPGRTPLEGVVVAAEERVISVQLVVDANDVLLVVVLERHAVPDLAAGIGRCGKEARGCNLDRRRAELRRRNPVVHKRRAQRDRAAAVALGRGERREVARQHRRGGDKGDPVGRRLAKAGALVAAEEKELVAHDRAADRAAELVAVQPVAELLAVRSDRSEYARRVEAAVAQELERVPVQVVGARLHDRIHRRRRVHAVLRRQPAGRDAELLQRIRERERQVHVVIGVVVHRAVERVLDAVAQSARDGNGDAAGVAQGRERPLIDRRAGQHDQVGDLAPLQRELHQALLLDDFADPRAAHVHERRGRLDRHRFFQVADRQRRRDHRVRVHLQHDARLHVGAESLQRHLEPIGADRQVRHRP